MKILLDESVPVQVRSALTGYQISTVTELGWNGRETAAEQAGFEVFILADKNLRYQQNLSGRKIALVELWTNHRPTLEKHFPLIATAVSGIGPGEYRIVSKP